MGQRLGHKQLTSDQIKKYRPVGVTQENQFCPETKYTTYVKMHERCNVESHGGKKGAPCDMTDFITEPVFVAQI